MNFKLITASILFSIIIIFIAFYISPELTDIYYDASIVSAQSGVPFSLSCLPQNCNMSLESGSLTVFVSNVGVFCPRSCPTLHVANITLTSPGFGFLTSCSSSSSCSYTFGEGYFSEAGTYTVNAWVVILCVGCPNPSQINVSSSIPITVTGKDYHHNPEGADIPTAGFMCSKNENGPWEVCEDIIAQEKEVIYLRDNPDTGGEYSVPGKYQDIQGRVWEKNGIVFNAGCDGCGSMKYEDGELHESASTQAFYPFTEITLTLLKDSTDFPSGTIPKTHYILSGEEGQGLFFMKWLEKNPGDF